MNCNNMNNKPCNQGQPVPTANLLLIAKVYEGLILEMAYASHLLQSSSKH